MKNFEGYIDLYIDSLKQCQLKDAISYSLKGGKRFRPQIIFSIIKGLNISEKEAYDAALALELIQTYSLIHDDLPAMDNDDLRRGKPSLHKAYREDIAILTGDQLLTDSFRVIGESKQYDSDTKISMINVLSRYSGLDGMIYGQLLDITSNSNNLDKDLLVLIQDNKTSGLFKVACLFAMYIMKLNDVEYFTCLGSKLGQVFQNQDDLFDLIKSESQTGKNRSDIKNQKLTALCLYSSKELETLINKQFDEIEKMLGSASFDPRYLKEILSKMRNR